MSTNSHVPKIYSAVLSIIFLIPPIIFYFMYTSIGWRYSDISQVDKDDTFTGYFPGFLRNINVIHGISILCCIVAITLASRSFRKRSLPLRIATLIVVLVAIMILFFDFSRMI